MDVLDVPTAAGDDTLVGFMGGFASGDFGYLAPKDNGGSAFGQAVRFDLATFTQVEVLDLPDVTGDSSLVGFTGGFAKGPYGYLVPGGEGSGRKGKVVRFGT